MINVLTLRIIKWLLSISSAANFIAEICRYFLTALKMTNVWGE